MKFILTFLICFILKSSYSQSIERHARLLEDGNYQVSEHEINVLPNERNDFSQLDNFPVATLAHPSFKNTRNVSIADINEDKIPDIVVCINEELVAYDGNGDLLWSHELEGTSPVPPAIADIDGDGDMEIAIQTYGIPFVGNVYLFDHNGKLYSNWPFNNDNHFFVNGITIADLDGNGNKEIIASERISSTGGFIHALNSDATPHAEGWPVLLNGTPAITPSIGDINNDGASEIISSSTTQLYAFDILGNSVDGFPFVPPSSKFSYQSPLLADMENDGFYEIVGAMHGDYPTNYIIDYSGQYASGWPVEQDIWTYATPALADINNDGEYEIFFGRPYYSETEEGNILMGYNAKGENLPGFPIQGQAGSEGIIAIADVDNDSDYELITSSTVTVNNEGFIHAYNIEDGTEAEGFPLRTNGFTFLNGAYLSDVNGDGLLDLTAISYQLKFDSSSPDSAFINVFNLEVKYDEDKILFNGYKGSNDHTGYISKNISNTNITSLNHDKISLNNPVSSELLIHNWQEWEGSNVIIYDLSGQVVYKTSLSSYATDIIHLQSGTYFLHIFDRERFNKIKFIKL